MEDRGNASYKTKYIALIAFFLVTALFFAFFLCNCVYLYSAYDVEYRDLTYLPLTFDRYEKLDQGKYGPVYRIYFKEYAEPFGLNRIANRNLDKVLLDELAEGTLTKVYFCEKSSRFSNYEICEISCHDGMLLSLSDYVSANRSNQMVGIILCPIMILISLFMVQAFAMAMKPITRDTILGKIKIEYEINGNIVRVYNSVHMCSLVINDKIVDQYEGIYGGNFRLKGRLASGGKTVRIEAWMGFAFMRLYCNGELVAKRFMAFG